MSLSPATRRRQQRLARWARLAPGYRLAIEQVLPRIRRNAVLSDLAWRVFAPQHGPGRVDVPLHAGRHLAGPDLSLLPVLGVLATGLSPEQATGLLDEVADLQQRTASFRPVLILDQPAFEAARTHGFVLEVLVPERRWSTDLPTWTDYVAARAASVIEHYQLWHLAVVADGHLDPGTVALLTHLPQRLPPDHRVRVVSTPADEKDLHP